MYQGKTILITGGTGSFGRTMARAMLAEDCAEIRVFSRDEDKQNTMRLEFAEERLNFLIGDVRDPFSVQAAMQGVDMVFHAAALKQVPSCEFFPLEAVRTNVIGSANVIDAATQAGVRSVVCLSTDKAVYPINAMGMTKALMEKFAQAVARRLTDSATVVSTVRYGNVMYSRGSVIPLFVRQIAAGGPVTVTEPSMTRFMLPLSDAVDLVKYALENADHGDIFVKKAPACTITDLVAALQQMFGTDVPVETIGMRHGEKLYETLASAEEIRRSEDMGDYLRIGMDARDLNYAKYFSEGDPDEVDTEDYHSHNTTQLSVAEVVELLDSLPEIRAALDARAT